MEGENYIFNTKWVYWYHSLDNDDWSEDTFYRVCTINTIADFWRLFNNLPTLKGGFYFLMREGISPYWSEEANSHLWWLKRKNLHVVDAKEAWSSLGCYAVGETLFTDLQNSKSVNGISVSPKNLNKDGTKGDWIFKIWLNGDVQNLEFNLLEMEEGNLINLQNDAKFIENDQKKEIKQKIMLIKKRSFKKKKQIK